MLNHVPWKNPITGRVGVLYAKVLSGPAAGYLLSNVTYPGIVRAYLTAGGSQMYYPLWDRDFPRTSNHFPYGYDVEPDLT